MGEAFNFPKNTNDGEKIFSGILERADSEQLFFRIQDTSVTYETSLRKNRKKKEKQSSNFKQLAVVRKEKFSFVEKIEKDLDLKVRPDGVDKFEHLQAFRTWSIIYVQSEFKKHPHN